MIKEISYPDTGKLPGNTLKERALCGGRNGISYLHTKVRITDLGDYIVFQPVTTKGDKANTFFDFPADPESLATLARHLTALAAGRAVQRLKTWE